MLMVNKTSSKIRVHEMLGMTKVTLGDIQIRKFTREGMKDGEVMKDGLLFSKIMLIFHTVYE